MNNDKRKKRAQALILVAIVLVAWNLIQMINPKKEVKIACVGDSLTYGMGVEDREENCYPMVLQNMLGTDSYTIGNFGVNGATLQKEGNQPYWEEKRYEQSVFFEPDIVVLMLGTNDTKEENWKGSEAFRKDYEALIEEYEKLDTKPTVILLTPPVLYQSSEMITDVRASSDSIVSEEAQVILEIGNEKELSVINLYELTGNHPEWYNTDGVHLNAEGAAAIADEVAREIKNLEEKEE
ncbi:MAG: GDSL-type esterase/lipase family protein [Oliverpabstia sp.]|nr:GDSL-type esterase/lipase family protein [Lachnospiraceae bacterium]MDY5026970.1 GDSL-type esterase/lipase family protein [Oliverpabstia sp.]